MATTSRHVVESLYVITVAALAMTGCLRQQPEYYLAAVVLALPLGVIAFVAVYGGYALIQAIGGVFASTTTADGSQATWLALSANSFNVAVITVAAIANTVLLRRRMTMPPRRRSP